MSVYCNVLKKRRFNLILKRVEQEMILLAQRVDVAEELDRLQMHVERSTF